MRPIGNLELAGSALLVLLLALLHLRSSPRLSRDLLISMLRLILQLSLIALVLNLLFAQQNPWTVAAIGLVMVASAGWEVRRRLKKRPLMQNLFRVSFFSMFLSSYVMCIFALTLITRAEPWYHPQYAIPLLGMLLGNTMNGISLGLSRLQENFSNNRAVVEHRLMMGEDMWQASSLQRQEALTAAMIPTINGMAAAGLVSLPGMMTGQILAGADPEMAVRYQIMIFLLIAAGTGFGSWLAIYLGTRQSFDERQRLRSPKAPASH